METGQLPEQPPRIWALLGPRTGDNNQVLALAERLAEALGGTVTPHRLRHNLLRLLPTRFGSTGLASLDAASRAGLAPPWPDLVIAVGRRSVPVARWIRGRSGGASRIVQIGRPRCHPGRFDLVLSTPQYGVPPGPSVLELPIALTRQTPARLAEAAATWRDRLAAFPPPRRALLLGGNSWPYRLCPAAAEAACRTLLARARAEGGSVLAIGSRRTPPEVARRVAAALEAATVPAGFLQGSGAQSPYAGLLALADEIIVTADSVAMVSEAVATGKPVGLVPLRLAGAGGAWLRLMRALRRADAAPSLAPPVLRAVARGWGALVRHGLAGWPRDLWFFWQALEDHRLAGPLAAPARGEPPDVAGLAVARITQLLPMEKRVGRPADGRGSDPPAPSRRDGYAAP